MNDDAVDLSQVTCFDQSVQHIDTLLGVVVVAKIYQKAWELTRNVR